MDKKDVSYRRFMMKLSQNLTNDDIDYLKYFYGSYVPSANREKIIKGIDLFTVLERANLLGPDKLDTLRFGFQSINREDLLEEITKQAAHLEDEFEEVQQSMQVMLEGLFVYFFMVKRVG